MTPEAVAAAIRSACLAELDALKPGNVHRFAGGHDMSVADFEASAAAIAPVMARPGMTVGERIFRSVQATHDAVGCNTNLGIVLLAAPLAAAATRAGTGDLRPRLHDVLARLDRRDAEQAYAAIRLAAPAGLGDAPAHDVNRAADVGLRDAMAAAADRDRIARQYVTDYADVFEHGVPVLHAETARGRPEIWAISAVYLTFLADFPDSHVARKFGMAEADALRGRAAPIRDRFMAAADAETMTSALLDLDRALKAEGRNPGTSADLTVATLIVDRLRRSSDASG